LRIWVGLKWFDERHKTKNSLFIQRERERRTKKKTLASIYIDEKRKEKLSINK